MAIVLLNQSQIKDYRSPTGIFSPTGLIFAGDITVTGLISGTSGNIGGLVANTLDISGAVRSQYLSGLVGNSVTGSGIVQFFSTQNTSGLNQHFRHVISTGNTNNPIASFSSQDSQTDWYYYNNGFWQSFPGVGLNTSQQGSSFVRHDFKPTGMDIFNRYFSDLQIIYQGNITGNFINSVEFQSPAAGFTIVHIPLLAEYFQTADSRYVIKVPAGTDYVASGVQISGLPITVPTYDAVPPASGIFATGRIISVSGHLFVYDITSTFTGFRAATPTTGFAVATGATISPPIVVFSGKGQVQTTIVGNDQIVISGGGVNQFAISGGAFKEGNIIFSGRGNTVVTSFSTPSGTVIAHSGGTKFAITGGDFLDGSLIFSGDGASRVSLTNTTSGTVISYTGGVDNLAIFASPARSGSVIFSGEGSVAIREVLTTSGAMFVFSGAGLPTGTGTPTSIDVSFFSEASTIGQALSESFVSKTMTFTGYLLGCSVAGSGDFPLSGTIYQRGTSNNKFTLANFTFQTGLFYKASGVAGITVTGHNRIGYDISNSLSGMKNFTISVLGSQ